MDNTKRRIGLLIASLCVAVCWQTQAQALTPISFSPSAPVAGDAVTASLTSIAVCGVPQVGISGSNIAIVNSA
jgi:hypothetical protein